MTRRRAASARSKATLSAPPDTATAKRGLGSKGPSGSIRAANSAGETGVTRTGSGASPALAGGRDRVTQIGTRIRKLSAELVQSRATRALIAERDQGIRKPNQ